jgi:peptidoglycan/LPS O-acetylase OafA/YrhL
VQRTGAVARLLRGAPGAVQARPVAPADVPAVPAREAWIDLLRAVALVQVVCCHQFDSGPLSVAFPGIGVMFAIGGSVMARSLRNAPAPDVIGHRLRRLLPPLWLLGAVLVPVMLALGWTVNADGSDVDRASLVYWLLPVLDPPGSAQAADAVIVLWYVRVYLWLVLLGPLLLAAFRRRPALSVGTALALVGLDTLLGAPLSANPIGSAMIDAATWAPCWLIGFAHRDGTLRRLPGTWVVAIAGVLAAAGLGWAYTRGLAPADVDLNDIPLAQALYSVAVVLVLLRWQPPLAGLARVPVLGRIVAVLNARAVTVYLWHNIAIDAGFLVADRLGWLSPAVPPALTVVGVALAVAAFGWAENLAAGRRVRLLPGRRRTGARQADGAGSAVRPLPSASPM